MKNGKKPTRNQRKFIQANGLNAENWMVMKDAPNRMELVHRFSDKTTRMIHKENER